MGIGACLAGSPVRYNGQTKAPNQHVRALGEHFEMRTFCPEMGIGLGHQNAVSYTHLTLPTTKALGVCGWGGAD